MTLAADRSILCSSRSPLSRLPLVAAGALSLAGVSGATRAQACSPLQCTPIHVAPEAGRTIPRNGVVLVEPGSNVDLGRVWPTLSLRRADGTPVATTSTEIGTPAGVVRVHVPVDGFVVGGYVASYDERCELGVVVPPSKREIAFTTSESRPFPASMGSLSVGTDLRTIKVAASGPCELDTLAATAELTLVSSPELVPWLPLLRRVTKVDGSVWATSPSGGLGSSALFRSVERLYAACAPPLGANPGLATGSHAVTIEADVPGLLEVPAVATTIDLRCGADAEPDGGAGDANPRDTAAGDSLDGAATDAGSSAASCGCRSQGSGRTNTAALAALAVLALLHHRRRAGSVAS